MRPSSGLRRSRLTAISKSRCNSLTGYGSDTPYDLVFKPLVETPGLKFVRADWRLRTDTDDLPAHFPTLPHKRPWSQLSKHPNNRDPSKPSDLLQWIQKDIERLSQRAAQLELPRCVGEVVSEVKTDRYAKRYLHALFDGQKVFCHQSEFIDTHAIDTLQIGDSLMFNVEKNSHGVPGTFDRHRL